MMNTKLLTFLLALILAGCQTGTQKSKTEDLPVIDLSKNYPEKEIILQDIADIEYIPLETTDDVLLGTPAISSISDKYIVIRDMDTNVISIFSRNGKLITHINRRGEGNEEYVVCNTAVFDEKREEIFVRDMPMSHRIQVYSLTGDYKRTLKLQEDILLGGLYNMDDETMLAYNEYNYTYRLDLPKEYQQTPYILVSKKDGSIISFLDNQHARKIRE